MMCLSDWQYWVCVCVCVWVYIFAQCLHVWNGANISVCACMCVWFMCHSCLCVCVHVMWICGFVCVCASVYICVQVFMCVCVCVYVPPLRERRLSEGDVCLSVCSTCSRRLDSYSRASCSFLLAFFSFFRRFWIIAEEPIKPKNIRKKGRGVGEKQGKDPLNCQLLSGNKVSVSTAAEFCLWFKWMPSANSWLALLRVKHMNTNYQQTPDRTVVVLPLRNFKLAS